MKAWIALTMLAGGMATGTAAAATTVNFGAAASCPTYCTGFVTSKAAYRLDWLNATYALTSAPRTLLSVNGIAYSGSTTATRASTVGIYSYYHVSGLLQAANGSTLTVAYMLQYWTTKVTSGRDAGRVVAHRAVSGGQLVFP